MPIHSPTRRNTLALIGGALSRPLAAHAQSLSRIPTIGVLWHAGSADQEEPYFGALRQGLEGLGYVDGRSINILHRFPNEKPELFKSMAGELVASNPDVLVGVTSGGPLSEGRDKHDSYRIYARCRRSRDQAGRQSVTARRKPDWDILFLDHIDAEALPSAEGCASERLESGAAHQRE
jgi:hypothetical protein